MFFSFPFCYWVSHDGIRVAESQGMGVCCHCWCIALWGLWGVLGFFHGHGKMMGVGIQGGKQVKMVRERESPDLMLLVKLLPQPHLFFLFLCGGFVPWAVWSWVSCMCFWACLSAWRGWQSLKLQAASWRWWCKYLCLYKGQLKAVYSEQSAIQNLIFLLSIPNALFTDLIVLGNEDFSWKRKSFKWTITALDECADQKAFYFMMTKKKGYETKRFWMQNMIQE